MSMEKLAELQPNICVWPGANIQKEYEFITYLIDSFRSKEKVLKKAISQSRRGLLRDFEKEELKKDIAIYNAVEALMRFSEMSYYEDLENAYDLKKKIISLLNTRNPIILEKMRLASLRISEFYDNKKNQSKIYKNDMDFFEKIGFEKYPIIFMAMMFGFYGNEKHVSFEWKEGYEFTTLSLGSLFISNAYELNLDLTDSIKYKKGLIRIDAKFPDMIVDNLPGKKISDVIESKYLKNIDRKIRKVEVSNDGLLICLGYQQKVIKLTEFLKAGS